MKTTIFFVNYYSEKGRHAHKTFKTEKGALRFANSLPKHRLLYVDEIGKNYKRSIINNVEAVRA